MKRPGFMENFAGFTLGINPIFVVISIFYLSIKRTKGILVKMKEDKMSLSLWGLLALSGIVSIIVSINKSVAITSFFIPFLFIWLYVLGRWAVENPEKFMQNTLRGIACLAFIAIISKIWKLKLQIGSIQIISKFGRFGRGEILYVADNSLGLLFQAGVIGAIGMLMIRGKDRSAVLQNSIIFLVSAIGVVITGSRGAIVGIFVAIVYLMLHYGLKAILGGAGLFSLVMLFGKRRFLSLFDLSDHDIRLQTWKASFQIIRDHLWFGVGPGNFGQIFDKYKPETLTKVVTCAHSNYLNIFIGWGIIGGVLFWGWQLAIFIRILLRGATPIQKVLLAILISYYAHVSINDLFTPYAGFFLGLVDHPALKPVQRVECGSYSEETCLS